MNRVWLLALLALVACGDAPAARLSEAELLDPEACATCHPDHVRQWSGSMHAYAAEDPVFRAMNARGQRETGGALGGFCVNCHAPMAVRLGLTADGLNLDEVPPSLRGVTCAFCHQVTAVDGSHDNPLTIATDGVMRGGIADPVESGAHESAYSPFVDRLHIDSASMCGGCHDIVTPAGVHLERTFAEWRESIFSQEVVGRQLTCGNCHMEGRDALAAEAPGVGIRRVHDHSMPGVDVALTPFAEEQAQRVAVQDALDNSLIAQLCVSPLIGGALVTLDTAFVGHKWPSGATQDRRAWVELTATWRDRVIYQSGNVADGMAATDLDDPDMWLLRDRIFDADGDEVHMFWEAASFESGALPAATTNDPTDPAYDHAIQRRFLIPGPTPDKVTLRVRIRPMALDVLDDLVATGDLAADIRDRVPTFTLRSTELQWLQDRDGIGCVP